MSQVTPSGQQAIPVPEGVRNNATRTMASLFSTTLLHGVHADKC
jgi:hypothetical protein